MPKHALLAAASGLPSGSACKVVDATAEACSASTRSSARDYIPAAAGMRAIGASVFEIDGPSMIPDLYPSDRVFCDLCDVNPGRDGMFAIWDGDMRSVVIKHVQLVRGTDPPRIRCSSSNKHYQPFEIILDGSSWIIGRLQYRLARI